MEKAAELARASILTDPRVPEAFHVGAHPPGLVAYWAYMIAQDIHIGVQLQFIPFKAYHLANVNEPLQFWDHSIQLVEREEQGPNIVRRVYSITNSTTGESRLFHHFQLEWPDMGLPDEDSLLAVFDQYTALIREDETRRRVHVHCWGGVGRSGTFVLARVLGFYPNISRDEAMDVLARLRRTRHIVETSEQEEFAFVFSQRLATTESEDVGESKASA